jgi:hypothetical protein
MGFIDAEPGTKMPVFYNLVHAVGKNCPNMTDDVKLVQYLLKSLYAKLPQSKPSGEIQVTGACDPITMNWILRFQMEAAQSYPGKILVDNRIDRIRQKDFIGSISHTVYTLAALNASCITYCPEAFLATPALIHLENPLNVPPPSWDIVNQGSQRIPNEGVVPASGGM